jgi:hypothetical protein
MLGAFAFVLSPLPAALAQSESSDVPPTHPAWSAPDAMWRIFYFRVSQEARRLPGRCSIR